MIDFAAKDRASQSGDLLAVGKLAREEEGFNEFVFAADSEADEAFEPFPRRDGGVRGEPVG